MEHLQKAFYDHAPKAEAWPGDMRKDRNLAQASESIEMSLITTNYLLMTEGDYLSTRVMGPSSQLPAEGGPDMTLITF